MHYIIYSLIAITVSAFFFNNYKKFTQNLNLIDDKNKHYALNPAPTGSGIIFLLIFLFGNTYFFIFSQSYIDALPNRYYLFLISLTILSIVSFRDDLKSIDPILRLIFQIIFVYLAITSLKLNTIALPDKLVFLIAVITWIYIINISNFIDGSDGFLITTFIFYCIVLITISLVFKVNIFSKYLAILCLPVALTFLFFNKPPAKLFMGDAGSIFIGFISGFFFLELIIAEKWYLAISLMSYKLIDCTYCLIAKIKRGVMPWVGLYDYFFLIPILKNRANHINVLFLKALYLVINFLIICIQEYYNLNFLFIISMILSILLCLVFKNLEHKYQFLKIKK